MIHQHKYIFQKILLAFSFLFFFLFSFSLAYADSMLAPGHIVNAKMKSLASGTSMEYTSISSDIKAIRMADSLPEDFVPSETNTVSSADSANPVYIFFDNETAIMYFYTEYGPIVMNPDSSVMFSKNTSLTDISGLSEWDSSNVTDMFAMFFYDKSLSDGLPLRKWDTAKVTDMSYMFSNALSLSLIDVSNWHTGNVTNMTCMFQVGESHTGNGQLREILGLNNLDVSNVTDMTCMFYGAGQMTYYDIADWDVSNVESMNHMFCDNYKLRSLDLSSWDVSSVKTIYCMFDDNHELKSIGDVSHWNTASLIDAGGWLNDSRSFVGNNSGVLDLSGWDTSNLKSAGEMFLNTKLRIIDLSGWTFVSITNDKWEGWAHGIYYETGNSSQLLRGFGSMFKNTAELTTVYVSQSGLDSFNTAVENEVNTLDMWAGSKASGFTVK